MTNNTPKPADAGPMPDFLKRQEPLKQEPKQEPLKQQRQEYVPHPIADIFPLMEGEKFNLLVADIKKNGLREPIWLHYGMILDGRNRYKACKEAGVPLDTKLYTGDDPVAFVLSANVHRRHLDSSQRAIAAAKLVNTKLGDNQYKGGSIDLPIAAKMLNVSEKSVKRAKVVLDNATPNIQALVESGKVAVSVAETAAKLPKVEQAELTTASDVAKAAKKATEEEEKKADGSTPKGSDKIDDLVETLITKLKEMKGRSADTAEAAVAVLIQRLRDVDLYADPKKKAA